MHHYTIAVICIIAISSIILFLILNKLKLLDSRTMLSVSLASLISAVLIPGIFYIVSGNKNTSVDTSIMLPVIITAVVIYLVLAFLLSVLITFITPRISAGRRDSSVSQQPDEIAAEAAAINAGGDNYLEQIFDTFSGNTCKDLTNNEENANESENNLEKSVDTSENIDKMGVENIVQNSSNMTIDECIEEAFSYKERGDSESAIIYFMYALDKNPGKELVFWIVLDICVLYKNMGQKELGYEILNSYHSVFGDIMNESTRKEIESNLVIMQY